MDAAVDIDTDEKHVPYGILGLAVGLVIAIAIAVVLLVVAAAAAYFAVVALHGSAAAQIAARAFSVSLEGGDEFNVPHLAFGSTVYVVALVGLFLVARWRGGADWRALVGWRPPVWLWRDRVLWGIAAIGLVYGFVSSAALSHFYPKSDAWLVFPHDRPSAALLLLLAVVLAPLAEETYFRGWIFTGLRYHWGRWPAIVISALLFGLAHYESTHLYALAVFPLGLVLGGLRERTGSARTSMLFHAINNLIAVLTASGAGS